MSLEFGKSNEKGDLSELPPLIRRKSSLLSKIRVPLAGTIIGTSLLVYMNQTAKLTPDEIMFSISIAIVLLCVGYILSRVTPFVIHNVMKSEEGMVEIGDNLAIIDHYSLTIRGYAAFEIKEIPLRIQGKLRYFVRSAMIENVPFFYIILNHPAKKSKKMVIQDNKVRKQNDLERRFYGTWETRIVIGTFQDVKISPGWESKLSDRLEKNLALLSTSFVSSFPHTRIRKLKPKELANILTLQRPIKNSSLFFWGTELEQFFEIAPMLAKNMRTVLPSEFIVPQDIASDIDIGIIYEPEGIIEESLKSYAGFKFSNILKSNTVICANSNEVIETVFSKMYSAIHERKDLLKVIITTTNSKIFRADKLRNITHLAIGSNASLDIFNPVEEENTQKFLKFLNLSLYASGFVEEPLEPNILLLLQRSYDDGLPTINTLIDAIDGMLAEPLPFKVKNSLQGFRNFLMTITTDQNRRYYLSENFKLQESLNEEGEVIIGINQELYLKSLIFFLVLYRIATALKHNDRNMIVFLDLPEMFLAKSKRNEILGPIISWFNDENTSFIILTSDITTVPSSVLKTCNNYVLGKITTQEDLKYLSNFVVLHESEEGLYSEHRHKIQQISFLRTLPPDRVILFREDFEGAIPLIIDYEVLRSDRESNIPMGHSVDSYESNYKIDLLTLEFRRDKEIAQRILMWIEEMPLTLTALTNLLDDVPFDKIRRITRRLQELSLIKPVVTFTRNSKRIQFEITEKGRRVIETGK
ncbi:MAG: hypothetical protein ACP6IS_04150 [Candidatus Asgardarchaeia archaeon]